MLKLVRTAREELDGFADGLLGPEDDVPLPKKASEAFNHIGDIRAMFFDAEQMFLDMGPKQSGDNWAFSKI